MDGRVWTTKHNTIFSFLNVYSQQITPSHDQFAPRNTWCNSGPQVKNLVVLKCKQVYNNYAIPLYQ